MLSLIFKLLVFNDVTGFIHDAPMRSLIFCALTLQKSAIKMQVTLSH